MRALYCALLAGPCPSPTLCAFDGGGVSPPENLPMSPDIAHCTAFPTATLSRSTYNNTFTTPCPLTVRRN